MKPWLRLTLITMTVGGGFTGFVLAFAYLLHPESRPPDYYYFFLFMTFFIALYAFVTISGLIFVQNPQRTFPLRLALLLQVPWISSPLIAYRFTAGFEVSVALLAGDIQTDYWLGSYWEFSLLQEFPWGFGVNLFAVLMLVLLARSMRTPNIALMPATAVPSLSSAFVEEIDRIVQRRSIESNMLDQSVHVYSQADGNVAIAVNNRVYRELNAIEDAVIRDLIQGAVDEWQNTNK